MRLSAPLGVKVNSPSEWIAALETAGYRAAFFPVDASAPDRLIEEYLSAAQEHDIVVCEVGAWSNPIDPDPVKAAAAIAHCQEKLRWAERIGARCCVNVTGSRNPTEWAGPHPENFSEQTFELIVRTTREIVDAVNPRRTFYTLEAMPWIFPSSPDEYLALLQAIDRPGVAVHLDPVNMINSPARAFRNGDLIRESFAKLGPQIKSCHAKDIILRSQLTVHLDECRPGTGVLDYLAFLQELDKLDPDTTIVLEHLPQEEYPLAAAHIREIAAELSIQV